jgi:monovalent cation:H+ antiporter-2, CPA2 family
MDFWSLLTDIGILLSSALILAAIFIRLKLNPITGYVLSGILVGGAGSLNLIKSPETIELISEIGIALLLFSLGLDFSWQKLKKFSSNVLSSGLSQILISPLILLILFTVLGLDFKISVFLALTVTLSSTATVIRSLIDQGEVDSQHGRNTTAVLLLQDIAVVPITLIISLLVSSSKQSPIENLLFQLLGIVLLIVFLYFFLNKIAVPLLSFFTLESNREMSILLASIISIGSAWAAHLIGISPAIGAFIAGMMLGSCRFAVQITVDMSPIKIIFLTLFFGSVGMLTDPIWIYQNWLLVSISTVSLILIKFLISFFIFKTTCHSFTVAFSSALMISQIGEFAFVLSRIAQDGNLLSHDLLQLIFSVTTLSILFTTFLIKDATKLAAYLQSKLFSKHRLEEMNQDDSNDLSKVFVFGYGPAGKQVVKNLMDNAFENISVIDLNRDSIHHVEKLGLTGYLGDIRQSEILRHFGVHRANLIVITVPSQDAALKSIENIRKLNSEVFIIVRSRYSNHCNSFFEAGANQVVNEELAVGHDLGTLACEFLVSINPKAEEIVE